MKKYLSSFVKAVTGLPGRETVGMFAMGLGVLLCFYGLFDTHATGLMDLWSIGSWKMRYQPYWSTVVIGLVFVIAPLLYEYLQRSHKDSLQKRLPNIAGSYWHYSVTGYDRLPSHNGKCRIMVDDNGVASFHGVRCYSYEKRDGKIVAVEKNWPQKSTWTDYGKDGWFRCEYEFASYHGYFKIYFDDFKKAKDRFDGVYYLFMDSVDGSTKLPNATFGTIVYERVAEERYEQVTVPCGFEVLEQAGNGALQPAVGT